MVHMEETKRKISEALKGKGKGRVLTEEHKRKIALGRTGKKHTEATKLLISKLKMGNTYRKGKPNPNATKNLGEYAKGKSGKDHPRWKGGLCKNGGYYYVYDTKLGKHFGGKYIKRANLVWYKHTGEIIEEPYFLHHKDWDKENDDIKNLEKMKRGEHSKFTTMFIRKDSNGRFMKNLPKE